MITFAQPRYYFCLCVHDTRYASKVDVVRESSLFVGPSSVTYATALSVALSYNSA